LSPAEKKKMAWKIKCLSESFKTQWTIEYEKHHPGEKMQLTGPDKGQIKLFFQTATITPRQVVEVAVDVWKNGRRGFWCDKLHSPFILLSKWSDIRAEIKNGGRGLRPHSTILPPGAAASTGNL
jgi:hypothetical protein